MSSPGASTPADASTLGTLTVTAFNVGMILPDSFRSMQSAQVSLLAGSIKRWLEESEAAAVALNELHSEIADKLRRVLREREARNWNSHMVTSGSNSLVWCVPQ